MRHRVVKRLSRHGTGLAAVLGVALGAVPLHGQAPKYTPGTILYPSQMKPWSTRMAVGVSFIAMPSAIVMEAAAIRWPLFGYDIAMGLPKHFSLTGGVSTEIVTNHFELGGRWEADLTSRLHADVGVSGAYWFGQMKNAIFDNTVHGWFTYPSVSLGYDFGRLALTAQAKASYVNSVYIRSGQLESQSSTNMFNGMSYRVALEQPFFKHTTIGLAFQMNRLKFYYPQWPLFPTFDRSFWMPEAQFRFTL